MLGEWHGLTRSVMPVWHDVHRTGRSALLADEAPADDRPGLILGQGVQPDVDHAPIAVAARALDIAGHVTVGEPFRRPPGGYLPVHRDCGRCEAIADDSAADDAAQIVNPLVSGTATKTVRGTSS
jgi:hypothetical protein